MQHVVRSATVGQFVLHDEALGSQVDGIEVGREQSTADPNCATAEFSKLIAKHAWLAQMSLYVKSTAKTPSKLDAQPATGNVSAHE